MKAARSRTRRSPPSPPRRSSAKSICWSPGQGVGAVAEAAAKIAGVGKVHVADAAHLEHQLAEDVAPIVAALMADHDAFLAPADHHRQEHRPARRRPARRDADLATSSRSRAKTPSPARSTPATPSPRSSRRTPRRSSPSAAPRSRRRRPRAASGTVEAVDAGGASGKSSFVGAELSKSERPELTSAKIIVSGGRAFGSNDQFHAPARPARRQARRRRSARAAPRSTPAMRPTTIRSARPARSSPPKSISRSAFRARSSTSPG